MIQNQSKAEIYNSLICIKKEAIGRSIMHSNKKMLCGGEGEQFLVDSIERKETR